ncbi:MAG: glycine cleavage system protein H [Planctomycetes bacterium RBG_16_64_10]|nr:MAG: glycine cleavage system protein H [Planctomycetes bacterium RBG_16_64_10]
MKSARVPHVNPEDLLYAKTHEWIRLESDEAGHQVATVGLSSFAVEALTDLVFIELPEVGREVQAGQSLGEIESVKAVSDIYAPVNGQIIAVNDRLPDALETLSNDPYGAGWLVKIRVRGEAGLADLMDHAAYQAQCQENP